MLTHRDEDMLEEIIAAHRIIIQAAAYTVYVELTPNNKKQMTQRDFHKIFKDNLHAFENLEKDEYGRD